ncbi:ribosome-associated heat shock protein Hsp15 [Amphritea sp. 1_MG-2023]|uniref:ribosome-associated heat shock protein Hsp15 n=1 Tax=Amphritea sp. 1_MG-2023 TaxID=3062670 RepID=UPI0026E16841|nr:ribosome-associated heat shock protein Hsp15 [Amphritea sp. 1_MG-2023]MDO6565032.1 ribosome-associated heat shock protein Hsp15 [Amphritea sp. 1_MG-2023]
MSKRTVKQTDHQKPSQSEKVRLDKWLWAARFFKTRGASKDAVEGGKVHYQGQRAKCSRIVELGAKLVIRQGLDEKTVVVMAISDQRRGAPEAQLLYQETEQSIKAREERAALRKEMRGNVAPDHRPNKKDRRKIIQFKDR